MGNKRTPAVTADDSLNADDVTALDMARWSYAEVLDATKHQDDKIGRFLTAIAFLTGGGLTLLFRSDLVARKWNFGQESIPYSGHGDFPLLAVADLLFFASVITAVAFLLISLSAPLRIPGSKRYGPPLDGSRIFFTHIGRLPADEWEGKWTGPSVGDMRRDLYLQFVHESHNLAERANLKYSHTRAASNFFIVGLTFLAASLVLVVSASTAASASAAVSYSRLLGLVLGLVFGLHTCLQLHAVARDQRASAQLRRDADAGDVEAARLWEMARGLDRVKWVMPLAILCLTVPLNPTSERIVAGLLFTCAAGACIWITRVRWQWGPRRRRVERVLEFGVLPTVLALLALVLGGVYPLALAATVPALLAWVLNARRLPRLMGRRP